MYNQRWFSLMWVGNIEVECRVSSRTGGKKEEREDGTGRDD